MRIELFTSGHATYVGPFLDKKLAMVLFCFTHSRVDEWRPDKEYGPGKGFENQLQPLRCEYHFLFAKSLCRLSD